MNQEDLKKMQGTEKFFKDAFCVDGPVRMILPSEERKGFRLMAVVELNDSRRGKFYLAQVEKI